MDNAVAQLLVLAGIALFLILRLRSVLGSRDGFEPTKTQEDQFRDRSPVRRNFEVIDGGPDRDIIDHVEDGSPAARAFAAMKMAEPGFSVSEFISGARGAYELILMGFEHGDLDSIKVFLSEDVYQAFIDVVSDREDRGLKIEAEFIGVRETSISNAHFDRSSQEAEITLRFVSELSSVVKDSTGQVVEGNATEIKKQRDVWTFARVMGSDDPNWKLVATDE